MLLKEFTMLGEDFFKQGDENYMWLLKWHDGMDQFYYVQGAKEKMNEKLRAS